MNNFVLLEVAKSEYVSALHWYSNKSLAVAERFSAEINVAIDSIARNPEQHPRWDDEHRYYLLSNFPYFVGYRYQSGEILIVAVRHTSQDQDVWADR